MISRWRVTREKAVGRLDEGDGRARLEEQVVVRGLQGDALGAEADDGRAVAQDVLGPEAPAAGQVAC